MNKQAKFFSFFIATFLSVSVSAQDVENYDVSWESDFNLPAQNSEGWSLLAPSTDSRLIYVSSSDGNDVSAQVYSTSDSEIGSDPQSPTGPISAYASIDAAMSQVREGFPDWVLLKRGDTWESPGLIDAATGRSASERSVISYYGAATARPLIETGTSAGIRFRLGSANYSALVGLHFYANGRDPDGPDFVGYANVGEPLGLQIFETNNTTNGILVEDCHFDFYKENSVQLTNSGSGSMSDVVLRRNIFTNSYGTESFSQGLYSSNASVFLEENLFDHNGWYQQSYDGELTNGQATIYNHNSYFTNQSNTVFRGNSFLRASSIQNKFTANPGGSDSIASRNILIDNNFYLEGEVAISIGGNTDNDNGPRWQNIHIANNVVMGLGRTQPTDRNLGRGIDIEDWQGGVVTNNVLKDWGNQSSEPNTYAIKLHGHSTNVEISENQILNIGGNGGSDREALVLDGSNGSGITLSGNEFQQYTNDDSRLAELSGTSAFSFSENSYYSNRQQNDWLSLQGVPQSYTNWVAAVGESDSSSDAIDYSDPDRSLESYMVSIGETGSIAAFVEAAISESRINWTGKFSAQAVNAYIHEGMCRSDVSACDDPAPSSSAPMPPSWNEASVSQSEASGGE